MIDKAANIYQSSFDGSHVQQLTHIPIQQKRPYHRKIGHVQQGVSQLDKRIDNRKDFYMYSTKQVNDIIIQESGIQYHQIYIYTLLWKWGFKQSTKKSTCEHRTHLQRKKNVLKKSKRNTG